MCIEVEKMFPNDREVYFLCIGSDRSTGDSFGPLVGTELKRLGIPNVVGCLEDTVHAMNLEERFKEIPEGAFVVAIDACLGAVVSVGTIRFKEGPTRPGAGVNKDLGAYGDYSIHGIVNVGGFMEYFVLQNTRLSLVMKMVEETVEHILTHITHDEFSIV